MLWKNKKIGGLSDRLANALPLYDMDELKKIRADIDSFKVEGLSVDLMQQLVGIE